MAKLSIKTEIIDFLMEYLKLNGLVELNELAIATLNLIANLDKQGYKTMAFFNDNTPPDGLKVELAEIIDAVRKNNPKKS